MSLGFPPSLRAAPLVVHAPAAKPEPLQRLAERILKAALGHGHPPTT